MSWLRSTWEVFDRHVGGRIVAALAVVGAGILVGVQYVDPNRRVMQVIAAAILTGVAWRISMLWAVGVLVLAVPYPRGTVFGNSNVALVLIMLVIWLLRITQRQAVPPRRTPVDIAIVGLLISYLISFHNVRQQPDLTYALQNAQLMVTGVLIYYTIVGIVRTEPQLRMLHYFQAASLFMICLLALVELNNPGGAFIPGWIHFEGTSGREFDLENIRVGGPFYDYELLAEFLAINLLLVMYLLVRAASRTQQVVWGGLLVLTLFVLFTTVTRGAIISLAAAILYLLWITRRRIRFVPFVIGASTLVALFLAMNTYVAGFTRSGDMIERLSSTRFTGAVPEARQETWSDGFERFLEHPIIGHGPYYSPQTGTRTWYWPHNGYLYVANLVGIVGFTFYMILMLRLLWLSRPIVDSLRRSSYASGFLIIGHVQLVLFMIDQMKIDFLRNQIYQFEIWIMLAVLTCTYLITQDERRARNGGAPAALRGAEAR